MRACFLSWSSQRFVSSCFQDFFAKNNAIARGCLTNDRRIVLLEVPTLRGWDKPKLLPCLSFFSLVLAMPETRVCRIHRLDPSAFRLRCCYDPGPRAHRRALDRAGQQQGCCTESRNGQSLCRRNKPQRCVGL